MRGSEETKSGSFGSCCMKIAAATMVLPICLVGLGISAVGHVAQMAMFVPGALADLTVYCITEENPNVCDFVTQGVIDWGNSIYEFGRQMGVEFELWEDPPSPDENEDDFRSSLHGS